MKQQTKKIARYSALALTAAAVLPMACKKDAENDDPNIVHRDLNVSIISTTPTPSVIDSIDINLDGVYDLGVAVYSSATGTAAIAAGLHNRLSIYCDTAIATGSIRFIFGADAGFTAPSPYTLPLNWKPVGVLDIQGATKTGGIGGKGDKYFSFVLKNGLKIFHGWTKVNISTDRKTLVVKDVAYSVLPDTPIKTGAK